MRINDRQFKILECLYQNLLPISVDELIILTKASKRSIRYDLQNIRTFLEEEYEIELFNKRGKGYYILPKDKKTLISLFEDKIENVESRSLELIKHLVFSKKKLSIDDISREMFFGNTTIRNIIKNINSTTKLNITELDHKVNINLSEYELRVEVADYLTKNSFNKSTERIIFHKFDWANSFSDIDVEKIINSVNKVNKEYNVWISNYAYVSVINYIIVSLLRVKNHKIAPEMNIIHEGKEFEYASNSIKNIFENKTNKNEIHAFFNFIVSKGVFIDNIEHEDEDFTNAINLMMNVFLEDESKHFNNEELYKDLNRHLYQFIRRNRNGYQEDENPILENIKDNYPKYFNLAKKGYEIFQKIMNINYSDSEVSYIAIYLYKNHLKENDKKHRIITVCGTGRGLAKLLQTRIENAFPNIEVVKNLSSYHFISGVELEDIDFIVSTVELPNINKDVVIVSSILGKNDLRKIRDYVDYGSSYASVPQRAENKTELVTNDIFMEYSKKYSEIFLRLYDVILDLPDEYHITEEKMLGLTIHLIIAIPRILTNEIEEIEFVEELIKIEKENVKVSKAFNKFFEFMENLLDINLVAQEKFAFYQYILSERKRNGI